MFRAGLIVFIFFCFYSGVFALPEGTDTLVTLTEVTVTTSRMAIYDEDQKVINLDTASRIERSDLPLGELLMFYLPVQILQYGGRGALTTLALRGNQSSQTQVLWNGFPVNSLTTGMADLSGIRSGLFGMIAIVQGAPGSLYGSGTAGGALMLSDRSEWKNGIQTTLSVSPGSFHVFSGDAGIKAGNRKIQYSGRIFGENAQNDFPYVDELKPGKPRIINTHGKYVLSGTYHSLFLHLGRGNLLQAGIWGQASSRQVPPIMGTYASSFQQQRDSSLRIFAGWEKHGIKYVSGIRTAFFTEGLRFTDKAGETDTDYSVNSHIRSNRTMTDAYIHWFPGGKWSFDIGGSLTLARAVADAYEKPVQEISGSLSAGAKYKLPRFVLNLTGRQDFLDGRSSPQVSAGIRYAVTPERICLRSRIYTHYRIPSLNDRYWNPGGNPGLKPEKGLGGSTGIEGNFPVQGSGNLSVSADVFYNRITDQIMWIPGTGYWSPVNLQESQMAGLEQTAKYTTTAGRISIILSESYHFTRSVIVENNVFPNYTGNTNPYIPRHSMTAAAHIRAANSYLTIFETFTGSRYTTMDNQSWYRLDPYFLTTVIVGYQGRFDTWKISAGGMVKNIFNSPYRYVSAWPVPGRSFGINLKITFNYMSNSLKTNR